MPKKVTLSRASKVTMANNVQAAFSRNSVEADDWPLLSTQEAAIFDRGCQQAHSAMQRDPGWVHLCHH